MSAFSIIAVAAVSAALVWLISSSIGLSVVWPGTVASFFMCAFILRLVRP